VDSVVTGSSSEAVRWLPWGNEAFKRARIERLPVLLAIGAAWCQGCARMLGTTYRDKFVCELIHENFIPIWVDTDLRPDINERYNLGGWPTTAFLSPAGQLLGGETFVDVSRMVTLLQEVSLTFQRKYREIETVSLISKPSCEAVHEFSAAKEIQALIGWYESCLIEHYDQVHGGFDASPKRVHPAAVQFMLTRVSSGDSSLRQMALKTLDAIGWGELFDDVSGGVFRYCAGEAWTDPQYEKLLSVNASVLDLFLEGWLVLGEDRYRDRAQDVIRYVSATLSDHVEGGFFSSQYANEDYYRLEADFREKSDVPFVDQAVYADGTAEMSAAYVRAAEIFNDPSLLQFAVASMERVVGTSYERGRGIAHDVNQGQVIRGLLRDQVLVSGTLIHLYEATDREVYLDLAQELIRYVLRVFLDQDSGGLFDRVSHQNDIGLMREVMKPLEINCAAVRVLVSLGEITSNAEFHERATALLFSQVQIAKKQGIGAGSFAVTALTLDI
tara:strand:- start:889 stop:2388 length:1500 start_codon:yes stop_codon:yes gene_type:complete